MAMAVNFEGANLILRAPKGQEETCNDLHVFRNRRMVVSCWQLDAAELEEIARTGCVYLSVAGPTHPPLYVATETEMRAFTAEYGLMPKQQQPASEPLPETHGQSGSSRTP